MDIPCLQKSRAQMRECAKCHQPPIVAGPLCVATTFAGGRAHTLTECLFFSLSVSVSPNSNCVAACACWRQVDKRARRVSQQTMGLRPTEPTCRAIKEFSISACRSNNTAPMRERSSKQAAAKASQQQQPFVGFGTLSTRRATTAEAQVARALCC
jgi:hypothetical protein